MKMYIYKSLSKFNETLRLNRNEKPLFLYREFCDSSGTKPVFTNRLLYFYYVIKELVHAFSCAYNKLWMHLGSLESTQDDLLSATPRASLTLRSPNCTRVFITRYVHAKHEPILK